MGRGGSAVTFTARTYLLALMHRGAKLTVLTTTIRTFGMHQLREYVSGLTHPLMVNGWRAGEDIEFTYHLGDKTGFQLIRTIRHDGR